MTPHLQAFVNLAIASITFLTLYALSLRFKIPQVITLLFLSLLPLYSLLNKGTFESGDLSINVVKSMIFYKSLSEGNLIPRWAGDLNAKYGYPLFIFTYPLPYYTVSLFHGLGFSFISSVKASMAAYFLLSGLAFYLFARHKFGNRVGLISSIFYLFAPYHLINLHFRVALGELAAFVFVPLSAFLAELVLEKRQAKYTLFLGISLAFLILSHQAISLVSLPLLALYCFIKSRRFVILPFVLALSLSAYYWIPVIFESKYTHQPESAKTVAFWPLSSYFYSPWRYGWLFQGHFGELVFPIGYIHLPLIGIASYLILKNKNRDTTFWLISFVLLFILMQKFSSPLWQAIPFLSNFQFSYRLMVILSFISALLVGHVFAAVRIPTSLQKALLFIVVITTVLNWSSRKFLPEVTDETLARYLPLATAREEGFSPASPTWTPKDNPWQFQIPLAPAEILEGIGTIIPLTRTSTSHTYDVIAQIPIKIKENTLYFPGWQLYVNDKPSPLPSPSPQSQGIVEFSINPGYHKIALKFVDTPVRLFAKTLSKLSLALVLLTLFHSSRLNLFSKNRD
ncbi:hypothetical protein A2634_03955 [Candidatus Amesbacteria bacterium RIFCSPHIGHO2_01_FULL_48_32]|uniref:Glycosyltransferase RgtA/B/C/D-like domain-containing protein n=1 Tax=Candidatus Amesbacteria bacterium RIFCSPLOWO2_01_FULL_48_25 TaxID=1797259 RepID=A0A1F4ZBA6_9BACT|nr:MAG: hypothetical protein A2634_03955 [Candidatus Amesbacteria bacterium RIFCSPHIGHO2_01_FULL_48_32]OGD03508.1 MAG: hypothetical protein A2989_02685 [Candidatus Amesbacteria bacterium RIFCSPLOWO2_01_FULL_48_25]HJZ05817.1 glycosyltransferase family 39 protein [Patescibacteria group bacterium]